MFRLTTPEKIMKTLLLALALSIAHPGAQAQAWPAKPVRAIVPVGAGSSTDIVHRLVLEHLPACTGQQQPAADSIEKLEPEFALKICDLAR